MLAPEQNHLLAALPPSERARVYPHLERVPLPLGKALYESRDVPQHFYLPIASITPLQYVLEDGESAEIAVVGNEGLIGTALFMGYGADGGLQPVPFGESTPCRWLLLFLDPLTSNTLTLTQEPIANMLGVCREGVTETARASCRSLV